MIISVSSQLCYSICSA